MAALIPTSQYTSTFRVGSHFCTVGVRAFVSATPLCSDIAQRTPRSLLTTEYKALLHSKLDNSRLQYIRMLMQGVMHRTALPRGTALNCHEALRCIALHCTTALRCTPLPCTFHFITFHSIALHCIALHCTALL